MNIQRASEQSGLAPATIRFYERKGVLPRPPRRVNGYRDYTSEHVEVLRLANGLRQLGVSLATAAPILAVAHSGARGQVRHNLAEMLDLALDETERQLADLSRVRDQLSVILEGLTSMTASDSTVPGLVPCPCIQLLAAASGDQDSP